MFDLRNWKKENHDFLKTSILDSPGLAAFDFDNTLIKGDLGEAVMLSLLENGLQKLDKNFEIHFRDRLNAKRLWDEKDTFQEELTDYIWTEYQYLMESQGLEVAYRWSSFLFSGWTKAELQSITRTVWNSKLKNNVYTEMYELIRFLLQNNWQAYIITASPTWVIQEVIEEFNLPGEHVLGMNLKLNDLGVATEEIIEPFTYGKGKVECLSKVCNEQPDLSFGDSENDLPLLKSAKLKGILIDKGNPALVKQCEDIGCLIQPVFK
ncbi:MAG: HAD-IB family phosphatase [Leptospiraceae bacterium]|nr:HAD-IB family phosphatase [Leptospiraceae bacterium]MCP5497103.1 HAD-IB family phosphatase [Leptospiraceae bacterium]